MSKTIRIEPGKFATAKECLESEADSISSITAGILTAQEAFTSSWEGEAAAAAAKVFIRALAATQLVQQEAGSYCAAAQAGVDRLIEADRQRVHALREKRQHGSCVGSSSRGGRR